MNTIDNIKSRKILVVCFTATTPHLETTLEITRRLAIKNNVESDGNITSKDEMNQPTETFTDDDIPF